MEEVKPPSLEDAFGDLKDPRTSSLRSGPETMAGLAQRIHLDPIGGIAGDMFVAALADAFPTLIPGLLAEVKKLPAPARGVGADFTGAGSLNDACCETRCLMPCRPCLDARSGSPSPSRSHCTRCCSPSCRAGRLRSLPC